MVATAKARLPQYRPRLWATRLRKHRLSIRNFWVLWFSCTRSQTGNFVLSVFFSPPDVGPRPILHKTITDVVRDDSTLLAHARLPCRRRSAHKLLLVLVASSSLFFSLLVHLARPSRSWYREIFSKVNSSAVSDLLSFLFLAVSVDWADVTEFGTRCVATKLVYTDFSALWSRTLQFSITAPSPDTTSSPHSLLEQQVRKNCCRAHVR